MFKCCSSPLYILYQIRHAPHSQSSLTFSIHSNPFQSQISFSSIPSFLCIFIHLILIFSPFCSFLHHFFPFSPIMKQISIGAAALNAMLEVSGALLVRFVENRETTDYRPYFKIGRLLLMLFLKWIIFSDVVPSKKISNVIKAKASIHSWPLKLATFASVPNYNFHVIDREQICQIISKSHAATTCANKDPRVLVFFMFQSVLDRVL